MARKTSEDETQIGEPLIVENISPRPLVSYAAICARLQCSKAYIKKQIELDMLGAPIRVGRPFYFTEEQIDAWVLEKRRRAHVDAREDAA